MAVPAKRPALITDPPRAMAAERAQDMAVRCAPTARRAQPRSAGISRCGLRAPLPASVLRSLPASERTPAASTYSAADTRPGIPAAAKASATVTRAEAVILAGTRAANITAESATVPGVNPDPGSGGNSVAAREISLGRRQQHRRTFRDHKRMFVMR